MAPRRKTEEESIRDMAVQALAEGADVFNRWRKAVNPKFVDLSGLELSNVDLTGADLAGFKLRRVRFTDVVLTRAILCGCNLNDCVLTRVQLTHANLRQARLSRSSLVNCTLNEANLYGTSRDGWRLVDITCNLCWITRDRGSNPRDPEHFEGDEFAIAYSGDRVRVKFPGGLRPIDLLSLPFYARDLLEKFADQKIVLAGLSTSGEPVMEFRVEGSDVEILQGQLQKHFDDSVPSIRHQAEIAFLQIANQQVRLAEKDGLIQELLKIVAMGQQTSAVHYYSTSNGDIVAGAFRNIYTSKINGSNGTISQGDQPVGDQYNIGQAGAVGPKATANHINQNLGTNVISSSQNTARLADELATLRDALARDAKTEEDIATVGVVTLAEAAAKQNDANKASEYLKKAGKWSLSVAEKIGVSVASEVIKRALGGSAAD